MHRVRHEKVDNTVTTDPVHQLKIAIGPRLKGAHANRKYTPQEAVALGRTVATVGPWRRSPDLKDLILLHEHLPEPRRQELVPIGEFVEGVLQERTLRRLAHHHHRVGAIDGDDRDDAPLHSGYRAARQTLGVCQTLPP
jgi:hypothetical protein